MSSPRRELPFQVFFRTEAAGGVLLLVSAVAALIVANSPWAGAYDRFWATPFGLSIPNHPFSLTLHQWINDVLMALFFLLVGLEIKRELVAGELASLRQAALPIAGAIGGMAVPALVYLLVNHGGEAARGWAIPTATDIAFALGTLALIAPRLPIGARVFLTALAIVDDMGAVIVIAFFYTASLDWTALSFAAITLCGLVTLNRLGVFRLFPYLALGAALWLFVHASGIHSTIAGVLLALTIPTRTRINAAEFSAVARSLLADFDRTETGDLLVLTSKGQEHALFSLMVASRNVAAPLLRLEHSLHAFSAFAIMPVFAFANAGVAIGGATIDWRVALGVALGLALGKPLGIMASARAAVGASAAALPAGVSWRALFGCAWLGGLGFTMSLFIATLAFDSPTLLDSAKVGIIGGSVLSALGAGLVARGAAQSHASKAFST